MNHCTAADLIAFESRIAALWEAGDIPYLLHLCGGNEEQLISLFKQIEPGDWIFSTHRSHYHFLLAGGDPAALEASILAGDSMFIFSNALRFFTSSVLAGTCAIAAGVAHAIKGRGGTERVWCFLGDGAEEQGHFYEAVMLVENQSLPCVFVVENNNRSVDTDIPSRRGPGAFQLQASCIFRYDYTPAYPHAGNGTKKQIQFKPLP